MSLAAPWILLLLLPALGGAIWLQVSSHANLARLPGDWHRLIEPALQTFMARYTVVESRPPIRLMLSIWTLLVLALGAAGYRRQSGHGLRQSGWPSHRPGPRSRGQHSQPAPRGHAFDRGCTESADRDRCRHLRIL